MAFIRPAKSQEITAEEFGQPVYDLLTPTPWVLLPLSNGWTPVSTPASYCRIGPVTYMRGSVAGTVIAAGTVIGTLPVGFRTPVSLQRQTTYYYGTWQSIELDIVSNGAITIGANAPSGPPSYMPLEFVFLNI